MHMKNSILRSALSALLAAVSISTLVGCGDSGDSGAAAAPSKDAGSASIGAAGGTVATASGAAKAEFPANAFTAPTAVTIAASSTAPPSTRLVGGTAYEFGPSGALAQPVTITLGYDPAALPVGALQSKLAIYKAISGAWVAVPGSVVDTVGHKVSAPLSSFSTYAVLADNQFAGSYSGTYSGASSGTWSAEVDVDGSLTATATGGFTGTSQVSFTGASQIGLSGSGSSLGEIITFDGTFTLADDGSVAAVGTWNAKTSGDSGTWTGGKAAAATAGGCSGSVAALFTSAKGSFTAPAETFDGTPTGSPASVAGFANGANQTVTVNEDCTITVGAYTLTYKDGTYSASAGQFDVDLTGTGVTDPHFEVFVGGKRGLSLFDPAHPTQGVRFDEP
jgi:hypothetical protein